MVAEELLEAEAEAREHAEPELAESPAGGGLDADEGLLSASERQAMGEDLVGIIALGGTALSFFSPTGGQVLVNRAPRATDALLELADRDERLCSFLRRFLARARYAALGEVLGEVVIAVGVDRGVIPPWSPITLTIQPEIQTTVERIRQEQAQAQAQAAAQAVAEAQRQAAQQPAANGAVREEAPSYPPAPGD